MIKKTSIIMFLCVVYILLMPVIDVAHANVKDCLEGGEDCADINEETPPEINNNEGEQPNDSNSQSVILIFLRMFFALVAVLGLIYILLRFLNKRHKLHHHGQALENLGGISVGQNKSIQVIRVGSNMYLIGVGENVELLHEIVDEDIKHDLLQKNDDQPLKAHQFITSFFRSKEKNNDDVDGSVHQFKHLFSNELDKLKQQRDELVDHRKQKEDTHE